MKVRGQAEKNAQKLSAEIHSVFVAFDISRDLSTRISAEHAYFREQSKSACFVAFHGQCKQTTISLNLPIKI